MNNIRDKIAIIGFGAAGYGTYLGLKEKGFKNIYIYNPANLKKHHEVKEWNQSTLKNNYRILKKKIGLFTVNSKTYFGSTLKITKIGDNKIYNNQIGGGLLNFWGGVMQTFDTQTLQSCLDINDLNDYYLKISNKIPISQIIHKNSKKNIYAKKNTINCNSYVEEMTKGMTINSKNFYEIDTIIATKQNNKKNCHCFIGCLKHTHFKTSNLDIDPGVKIINEIVEKVDFEKSRVITNSSKQVFDKIYLNAGPYHDQKILIQSSINNQNSIKIKDSSSFTFPIFFKGRKKNSTIEFALTNRIFCVKENGKILGHIQIYPPIDHINKSLYPSYLWDKLTFIKNISTNRLLWARCYLSDKFSRVKNSENQHEIYSKKNDIKIAQKKIIKIFKSNLNKDDFLPLNFIINSKTSSHYAGDYDHITKNILKQSENHYKKKIFFNDSLLWRILPSYSPTFTIMANAMKCTDIYL